LNFYAQSIEYAYTSKFVPMLLGGSCFHLPETPVKLVKINYQEPYTAIGLKQKRLNKAGIYNSIQHPSMHSYRDMACCSRCISE